MPLESSDRQTNGAPPGIATRRIWLRFVIYRSPIHIGCSPIRIDRSPIGCRSLPVYYLSSDGLPAPLALPSTVSHVGNVRSDRETWSWLRRRVARPGRSDGHRRERSYRDATEASGSAIRGRPADLCADLGRRSPGRIHAVETRAFVVALMDLARLGGSRIEVNKPLATLRPVAQHACFACARLPYPGPGIRQRSAGRLRIICR